MTVKYVNRLYDNPALYDDVPVTWGTLLHAQGYRVALGDLFTLESGLADPNLYGRNMGVYTPAREALLDARMEDYDHEELRALVP